MPNVPSEMNKLLSDAFKAELDSPTYGIPRSKITGVYTYPVLQSA